jgi:hypothetical protein
MLFNLTTHASFPCKKPSNAIWCDKNEGPSFGNNDLSAHGEPLNKEDACWSWTNRSVYSIPENSEGINMLTNMKNNNGFFNSSRCEFTISELEIWGVSFSE